jgi:hypothetical protein
MVFLRIRRLCVLSTRPHDKRLIDPIPAELSIRIADGLAANRPEAAFHRRLLLGKKRNDIFPYDTPTGELLLLVRTTGVATDPDGARRNGSHRIYHL